MEIRALQLWIQLKIVQLYICILLLRTKLNYDFFAFVKKKHTLVKIFSRYREHLNFLFTLTIQTKHNK